MIKAIIFDFDGVIIESADIKTGAFRELFSDYPEKAKEIINYHLINAGISRYIKFRHIYEHILQTDLSKDAEVELGKHFSQIVFQKVVDAHFVAGTREFLDVYKNRYQFFIASGTPEEELCKIINEKGLQGYFKEMQGSPKGKVDIVISIIKNYNFAKEEVVYIGDAQSDRIAAKKAGIVFIERRANLNSRLENRPWIIKDLTSLHDILQEIESDKKHRR
ncbi:MAG: HAD family hydrolase [Candidatus Omnitrophota bacterium]|nr:HAD family hydrolase [Candidatus Omnitrophota bacterium]